VCRALTIFGEQFDSSVVLRALPHKMVGSESNGIQMEGGSTTGATKEYDILHVQKEKALLFALKNFWCKQ
jgi:hypothetical protein